MTDASMREVAELGRLLSKNHPGKVSLHQGIVAGFGRGTIQVLWQGESIGDSETFPIGGIRFVEGYHPKVGDAVWALGNDGDRLVLGRVNPADDIVPDVVTIGVDDAPPFLNGWANQGGAYGPARYWIDSDGWLHMAGFVRNGTATSPMFQLPVGHRPNAQRRITVVARSGATGHRAWGLAIDPDGEVRLESKSPPGDLNLGVSLNGVRFQVEDGLADHSLSHQWTPFIFANWTWFTAHDPYDYPAAWQRWDGLVRTRGIVSGLGSDIICNPPERACKRRYSSLFLAMNDTGTTFETLRVDFQAYRRSLVCVTQPGAAELTLDGFQWQADMPESDMNPLKLETGWNAYSPEGQWGAPVFFMDGHNVVHVQGLITGGTTTNGTPVGWLPEGFRPPYRESFLSTQGAGAAINPCRLDVDPSDGFIYLMTSSAVNNHMTLDHISFSTEL